jgi:hypothetical protein
MAHTSIYEPRKRGPSLRGCISLKNRSYRPQLRHSTSPFKSTCLLINSSPAIGSILSHEKGVLFLGGYISLKNRS